MDRRYPTYLETPPVRESRAAIRAATIGATS
jgi:hypothetical protein